MTEYDWTQPFVAEDYVCKRHNMQRRFHYGTAPMLSCDACEQEFMERHGLTARGGEDTRSGPNGE